MELQRNCLYFTDFTITEMYIWKQAHEDVMTAFHNGAIWL